MAGGRTRVAVCRCATRLTGSHRSHSHSQHVSHASSPVQCVSGQSRPRSPTRDPAGSRKRALTVSLALLFFFTLLINVTDKPDVVGISATPHTSPLFTCLPWSTACYALSTLRTTIFLTEATTLSLAESTFAHEMRLPTLTQTKMLPTTPTSLAQRAGASARA